ncbi:elongation factor P--(R)-beta-lysine ligase [Thalassotalea atypica]|uniref:elongation factor P--(R)-beta-lysine ligase n=1 Tax=Thalassotalea atypica TaxID=2054316 RepID=UPI0025740987|nr:elongation factor P--(R)-beta-lysine ligase [Thalassotalea atypica]
MSWQPTMSWESAQRRANILTVIRAFFLERGVTEVETPLMTQGTVTDVHLDAFETRYDFLAEGRQPYYLQTSPEFAMKRLLASGYGCIYQICKAFRHEGHGRFHNPEFTMLEWYRLGFNDVQLMDEIDDLLKLILKTGSAERLSYQEAFIRYVGIDPLNTNITECLGVIEESDKSEEWLSSSENLDTLLQFIFNFAVEPNIGNEQPCFIYSFPASQASLAKLNPDNESVAQRFECYFKGVELVNGFNELTDPIQQRARFVEDNKDRIKQGLSTRIIDERFIRALENGLPDCSGVALGIDRLVMLSLGSKHIDEVMSFPVDKA